MFERIISVVIDELDLCRKLSIFDWKKLINSGFFSYKILNYSSFTLLAASGKTN